MPTNRCFGRHPSSPPRGRHHAEQLGKLHRAVREVLREAIALGGSSISDYVDANGEEGFFQLQHRVYGREGEPCLVCGTADPARCAGRTQQSLLLEMSKIALIERFNIDEFGPTL
jgi:formamidopyrimidine-DNA glycosylase